MKTIIVAAVSFLFVANISAQEHAIDTKLSTLTILVGKAGIRAKAEVRIEFEVQLAR